MKQNQIIILVFVALIAAGTGFFGGMKYQQGRRKQFTQFAGGQGRMFAANGGRDDQNGMPRSGFRPITGQIIAADAQSVTVKLPDGSSKLVLMTGSTTINQTVKATKDDLKNGLTVAVFSTENSDGSVTATDVQISPVIKIQNITKTTPAATK